jgi:hypothetical protein
MPRYYFDLVTTEGGRITDQDGIEFADLEAAKTDALHALAAMGAEEINEKNRASVRIEIRDEADEILCRVSLSAGADC